MGGPILDHISASTSRLAALRRELAVLLEEPVPEEAADHEAPTKNHERSGLPSGFSPAPAFLQPLQKLGGGLDSDKRQRLPVGGELDSDMLHLLQTEGKKRGTAFSDEVLMAVISRIAVPTSGARSRRVHVPSNLSSRVSSRRNSRKSSAVPTPRGVAPPAPSDAELADALRVSLFTDQLVRKIASKLGRSSRIWDSPSASGSTTPGGGVTPRVWESSAVAAHPPARQMSPEKSVAEGAAENPKP
jgi:hypothetical protein